MHTGLIIYWRWRDIGSNSTIGSNLRPYDKRGIRGSQEKKRASQMDIAYALLGKDVRLFDHLSPEPIYLEHLHTLEAPGAIHISFRILK